MILPKRYEQAKEYVEKYNLEKMGEDYPSVFLDLHPEGSLAALQKTHKGKEHAAVYDLTTGKVVWQPEGVIALCWLPKTDNILLVRELYHYDSELHNGALKAVTPFQDEFLYYVECWSWPERQRLSGCELTFPTGWPVLITVSPNEDLAAVQWNEQDDSGIELFSLRNLVPQPLPQASFSAGTNLTDYPLFSQDGRYLVLVCSREQWWKPETAPEPYRAHMIGTPDPYVPDLTSPGGRFLTGEIVALDTQALTYRSYPLYKDLPAGWEPEDRDYCSLHYMLHITDFSDPTDVRVMIRNQWHWTVDISE